MAIQKRRLAAPGTKARPVPSAGARRRSRLKAWLAGVAAALVVALLVAFAAGRPPEAWSRAFPPLMGLSQTDAQLVGIASLLSLLLLARSPARRESRAEAPSASRAHIEKQFWKRELGGLLAMAPDDVIDRVREIAAHELRHPLLGRRRFAVAQLLSRLEELRRAQGLSPLFREPEPGVAAASGVADAAVAAVGAEASEPPADVPHPANSLVTAVAEVAGSISGAFQRLRYDHAFDDRHRIEAMVSTDLGLRVQAAAAAAGKDRPGHRR